MLFRGGYDLAGLLTMDAAASSDRRSPHAILPELLQYDTTKLRAALKSDSVRSRLQPKLSESCRRGMHVLSGRIPEVTRGGELPAVRLHPAIGSVNLFVTLPTPRLSARR